MKKANKFVGSKFNFIVDEVSEKVLVYNTFSGSVCQLEKNIWEMINLGKIEETHPYFNALKQQGLIVPKEVDEIEKILTQENIAKYTDSKKHLHFVIAPTLKCNLRCYYCFEPSKCDSLIVTNDTLCDILHFIESSLTSETKTLKITWFGGEPLLAKDSIIKFSEAMIKIAEQHFVQYASAMITNGICLTKEIAGILKSKCKVQEVQITLDGDNEEYCKRKGATSSIFNKVINNIVDAAELLRIQIRLNCDGRNYDSIVRVVDELFTKYNLSEKITVYLAQVTDYNGDGFVCCNSDDFNKLVIKFNTYLTNKYPLYNKNLTKKLDAKKCYCALKKCNNFAIGPKGELYTCEHDFGIKGRIVGDVKKGLYYTKYHKKFLELHLSKKCKQCKLLPLCLGGCPSMRYNSKKEACCTNEELIKYLIKKKINYKM